MSEKSTNKIKQSRTPSHVIETNSRDIIRSKINTFYTNGDALFRELTERDYGIDAVVELFCAGNPTGQFALLQIKGTQKTIVPLKNSPNLISCPISTSNAKYALQSNIPVMLIYITLSKPESFYYINLNSRFSSFDTSKLANQKSVTINIPTTNNTAESLEPFFDSIRSFYNHI